MGGASVTRKIGPTKACMGGGHGYRVTWVTWVVGYMVTWLASAADAVGTRFGVRREAKRHAALGSTRGFGKRCRRSALPPQSIALPSGGGVAWVIDCMLHC